LENQVLLLLNNLYFADNWLANTNALYQIEGATSHKQAKRGMQKGLCLLPSEFFCICCCFSQLFFWPVSLHSSAVLNVIFVLLFGPLVLSLFLAWHLLRRCYLWPQGLMGSIWL